MVGMRTVTRNRVLILLGVAAVVIAGVVVIVRVLTNPAAAPVPSAAPVSTSEPVPVTSRSVQIQHPQGFPDLDGLADVSQDHDVSGLYPLATFTSPTGLQCAMLSNRGGTAAFCYGPIPGLDHPANQVQADDYGAQFNQSTPPDADKLNGKPLASGQKVVLGAGGTLMGGDQITCGVEDVLVACVVIRGFDRNHGDDTAQRHGFVLSPQGSWTF